MLRGAILALAIVAFLYVMLALLIAAEEYDHGAEWLPALRTGLSWPALFFRFVTRGE